MSKTGQSGRDLTGYLERQLLVAMPGMPDSRFARTVIYVCSHNVEGAMGLVINKPYPGLSFTSLLQQLSIETTEEPNIVVRHGGPVETGRGFVLHSTDYLQPGSVTIDEEKGIGLTATLDVLRAIATGTGPQHKLFALGYAGWGAGQLDTELQENGWLTVPAEFDLIFDPDLDSLWERSLGLLGISAGHLASVAGHA